jgi:hypothetical protein
MQEIHGTAVGTVIAAPDATFRLITDIDRLPEWNRAIERVVEPAPELTPGTEWVVKMHSSRGMTWQADRASRRSTVMRGASHIGPGTRTVTHHMQTGNGKSSGSTPRHR